MTSSWRPLLAVLVALGGCAAAPRPPEARTGDAFQEQGRLVDEAVRKQSWVGLTKAELEAALGKLGFRSAFRYSPRPKELADWMKEWWGTDFEEVLYAGTVYPYSDLWILFRNGKVCRAVTIHIE